MLIRSSRKTKRLNADIELFVKDFQSKFDIDLQRELRVGNVVLIKDYLPRNVNEKFYNQYLVPKVLDRYWMYYLNFKGFQECVPIPLSNTILKNIPELEIGEYGYNVTGTNFFVECDEKGNYDVSILESRLVRIKFVHQLQNVVYDLTSSEITITDELIKYWLKTFKDFTCSSSTDKLRT